jgi:hypothetical protein
MTVTLTQQSRRFPMAGVDSSAAKRVEVHALSAR